jgi:uncharacterized protein YcbK (DUF882 family)
MASAEPCPVLSRRSLLGGFAAAAIRAGTSRAKADFAGRLALVRPATGEVGQDVPFSWDGAPCEEGLAELDWLMRDVQAGQVQPIDLRVYYLLAMTQVEFGGRPIIVTSDYRTKASDDRVRRQGIDAARNSFHLSGQAADIRIHGVPPARIAAPGSMLGLEGVGIYPTFVHLDTGPQRFWKG